MINQFLAWVCIVAGSAAFCYKLPGLLRNVKDYALLALCSYFLCSALSFILFLDTFWPHIESLFGYRNSGMILMHALVVVLTAMQQVVLVFWSYPPEEARRRALRRIYAFGFMLALLVAFFFIALPNHRHGWEDYGVLNIYNPPYPVYLALYLCTVASGQLEAMRLSVRYARMIRRSWLRRGMQIMAAGAFLVIVYSAMRYVEILAVYADLDVAALDDTQWFVGNVGSLFELIGWTIPGWGPLLSSGRQWIRNYRAYRRLRPLWTALYRALPVIALDPPRSRFADVLPVRDLQHRLYRRVIEIRDAQLALRAHADPMVAEMAQEQAAHSDLPEDRKRAVVEASMISAALIAKDRNASFSADSSIISAPKSDDFRSEITWLIEVADAFVRLRPEFR